MSHNDARLVRQEVTLSGVWHAQACRGAGTYVVVRGGGCLLSGPAPLVPTSGSKTSKATAYNARASDPRHRSTVAVFSS